MKHHMKAKQIATEEDKQVPGEVFSINLSNVIEAMDVKSQVPSSM